MRATFYAMAMPLLISASAAAQSTFIQLVDDFEGGDLSRWQSSMSPEYYKGGEGRKGIEIVQDAERGKVLRCDVRFVDPRGSEPAFITRRLDPKPRKIDVTGVRFWAKLTEGAIDPKGGFKVRLRTGDNSFTDYDVQQQLGRPFPAGEWVRVELDTRIGANVRNVWGKVFGVVRQMTFRLDDIDEKNAHFALLLDDVELIIKQPPKTARYKPRASRRVEDGKTRILLLKHRAAGYYNVEEAIGDVASEAEVDTFFYRGLHFEFFGFPKTRDEIIAYDAIIMLDVDPFMMTFDQCTWVADAVASGSNLIVFGGPVTLTHSKDFKAPLLSVLPVEFETGAKDIRVSGAPETGDAHFLNKGFDPAGLGRVSVLQDLKPKEGAEVPWRVKGRPLVVTMAVQRGRTTLINTWPQVAAASDGGFFTSPLSDDLMRQLIRFALNRVKGPSIEGLKLPRLRLIGGGRATLRARSSGAKLGDLRLLFEDGRSAPCALTPDKSFEFSIEIAQTLELETPQSLRLERLAGGEVVDVRDFDVVALNPLDLDVAWRRNKYTFAPGSTVELTVNVRRRDVPRVEPGPRVRVAFLSGVSLSIDGFVDSWVYKPGTDIMIHNQVGDANVRVESVGGWLPSWTVTGEPRSARTDSDLRFGDDDRILKCRRTIECQEDGSVRIVTAYEFRRDMKVMKLPLTLSLPVEDYAGLAYQARQREGVRKGVFPVDVKRGKMFDGTGLDMTVDTPNGPIQIKVLDPSLRVWLRDLRQYDMDSYRLEIEAPYENSQAKKGEEYTIPILVKGPVSTWGRGIPKPPREEPTIAAAISDPRSGFRWTVPIVEEKPAVARFAGRLPNLASGEYRLTVDALIAGKTTARRSVPCYVVDPLDSTDFFPIMSIIGVGADGHFLDEAGIRGRVDDLIGHGFNTAAITGTSNFKADHPSNAKRLVSYSESYAQQRGMATTYEYSNFNIVNRRGATRPCVSSPEFPDALKEAMAWQIDVGNRTPRLLTAKVIDEPTSGVSRMDFCEHCKSAFKEKYGVEMKRGIEKADDPYARWALADFIGSYVGAAYAQGARIMREEKATFDLLLTYMATGLGYQRPLTSQQDTLDWSRHVGWADFDVYPYFYPRSQRLRMVQASFAMTFMRDVARARNIPWGFYMELDDRNWPFQKNPKEATAECGFTAVAHGAGYLNSFINRVASTGCQSRPERWEAAGRALRAIRRIGPILRNMPALPARLAILFPNSQEAIANGYPRPEYTLQALKGGFGDVDIHNEQLIVETRKIPYKGLLLLKTEFVHESLPPLLTSWLKDGGVLFCDRLPTKTHRGEAIEWEISGAPADKRTAARGGAEIHFSETSFGKGRVVFIENDIEDELKSLVEAEEPNPEAIKAYRLALGDIIKMQLRPLVSVEYSETPNSVDLIEAGLRGNDDAMLLILVNHQPDAQEVRVAVDREDVRWLVDVATMRPVDFTRDSEGRLSLTVKVSGRWARMFAGYRTVPKRIELEVQPNVKRGEELRYTVSVIGESGDRVKGGVLLEIETRDPSGAIVTRYGCSRAPHSGGLVRRVRMAQNAPKGAYSIVARAPQIAEEARASFEVR